MNEWPKRPDGTPIHSAHHRRIPRGGSLWKIVGVALAVLVIVLVIYLYSHRPLR
jgi:hypothetical protein